MQGALARAIAENPALAAQDTSLQRRADKVGPAIRCLVCEVLCVFVAVRSGLPAEAVIRQRSSLSSAVQATAEEEKASGNRAFGAKEYEKAVAHFTVCIRLDPE